ncbi:DUF3892 domain-containing protein [Photobacterium aphoticum]|uniref:DUF3892 domain-containing protein n=1 Tax=Photobacterium aphoticum TaxID=754436 RepID=A0A0J1GFI7_9GAMM|nr:DUF3892 domain-containing protein [Photobacterium aphoticum]KLU98472.1 hypothetical protein ABT58_22550 [Photobacterium aphoticum]PSU57416.1 DUF3892 domain-containing protein [Photobacterium aphoticum]GHA63497.1 hypothetical protein GCM10007086_41690 [Photobacterium aphoticum]
MTKQIIAARKNSKGNITKVRFKGNSTFTSLETAIKMAKRGQIENTHSVKAKNKSPHIRTNPDKSKTNNLDELAK